MKHIVVRTDSVIGRFKTAKVTWCDVWLRMHRKRMAVYLAPTLCGYLDLLSECDLDDRMVVQYPAEPWAREDYDRHRWAQQSAESNTYAVDNYSDPEMPEIFTRERYIDRAEAERLLTLWLSRSLHVSGPFRFHWKPPRHIIGAMTVNSASVREETATA